jgi:hypothetical protein
MEPEVSLPSAQEPTTGTHPEPDKSSPHPTPYFHNTHLRRY